MESLELIDRQWAIEEQYNRKLIDRKIRKEVEECPVLQAKIVEGVALVEDFLNQDYYGSKNARLAQVKTMDLTSLVTDLYVGVAYCLEETLFTAVVSLLAGRLGFDDKVDAITTVAELLAVLCHTDVFDIRKESKQASLMLKSNIVLSKEVVSYIENSQYLPPMVVEPLPLTHNYSNGHLTYNDSLILGTGNHHDGDICLDVLNTINRVPLRLDTEFLSYLEEHPTFALDTQDKVDQWDRFKRQSYKFYVLMAQCGNKFHLTHKVDKRGRIYSSGYHISTQGTPFKKACVELYKEELVTGVPT